MKQLPNTFVLAILLHCLLISPVSGQTPRPLYPAASGTDMPQGWWEISTDTETRWRTDRQAGVPAQEGLYIHKPANAYDDMAVVSSGSYALPHERELWLGIDLTAKLGEESEFYVELWNGRVWKKAYSLHSNYTGSIYLDLNGFSRTDFQMKFVFLSAGGREAYVSISRIYPLAWPPPAPQMSGQFMLTTGPNPFHNSLQLQFYSPQAGSALCQISDMAGRLLYQNRLPVSQGMNEQFLQLQALKPGMYLLSLATPQGVYARTLSKY